MRSNRSNVERREQAIGLVELVVIMLIIAIIMTFGFYSVRSARSSGNASTAIAVAHEYANAIDQFARDHQGRFPTPSSEDWPAAEIEHGPTSAALGDRTYLRSVPEAVQGGIVVLGPRGSAPAGVTYRLAPPGYVLQVDVQDAQPCVIRGGGAPDDGQRECSRR